MEQRIMMTGAEATAKERSSASRANSPWLVIDTVHDQLNGDVLYVQAVLAADDPLFEFYDPADYPRLPASVVEDANRRHRKAHRVYERTALSFDTAYWDSLYSSEDVALKRMAIHRREPWNCGGVLVANAGGYIVDGLPPLSGDVRVDWIGEMVLDLLLLRREKDYETADALRREIVLCADAQLFITKDGIEFVDTEFWNARYRVE